MRDHRTLQCRGSQFHFSCGRIWFEISRITCYVTASVAIEMKQLVQTNEMVVKTLGQFLE